MTRKEVHPPQVPTRLLFLNLKFKMEASVTHQAFRRSGRAQQHQQSRSLGYKLRLKNLPADYQALQRMHDYCNPVRLKRQD